MKLLMTKKRTNSTKDKEEQELPEEHVLPLLVLTSLTLIVILILTRVFLVGLTKTNQMIGIRTLWILHRRII
jgi:hypothetical protein